MLLTKAPAAYNQADQSQLRGELEREDKRNQKIGSPILIQSPNGAWWKLSVDNAGALTAVAA
jgi:hypothetical protein